MMYQVLYEYGVDLARSSLVGDKTNDLLAVKAGEVANRVLVRSGHQVSAD